MKKAVIGILAHVDAGKTTLSEAMLYQQGVIRKLGRVDKQSAFFDHAALERERGMTIFSKEGVLRLGELRLTLLDTPGHVDFSAEMERVLGVLDYAILVISGSDGVQGHTRTLWRLLAQYQIPCFVFVNKMDQTNFSQAFLLKQLQSRLNESCIDFTGEQGEGPDRDAFMEQIATCDDDAFELYLKKASLGRSDISKLIATRKIFPCFFGSALKLQGMKAFMEGLERWIRPPIFEEEFGAKVFKITRDPQGKRLSHLKITGGQLEVKMPLVLAEGKAPEKVDEIRIYSGEKYRSVSKVSAGEVCAVTGLSGSYPGKGLGGAEDSRLPQLQPVMHYRCILPEGLHPHTVLQKFRILEDEDPLLHIQWQEALQEIHLQLMGEIQLQVLKHMAKERFDLDLSFDAGHVIYKETLTAPVIGRGHFEPLRHYAEVHLLLEPGERDSGLMFRSRCSLDVLDRNHQNLVLTRLKEAEYPGVLTGSPITDLKISLLTGKGHLKHTEGGDFRQATDRALQQGLKTGDSLLLEPWYEYRLELPPGLVGRALSDLQRMQGTAETEVHTEYTVISGEVPVSSFGNYGTEIALYSHGEGRVFYTVTGYRPCHNAEEIIAERGYESEKNRAFTADSVFCSHGSGFIVKWNKAADYMHLESKLEKKAHLKVSEGKENRTLSPSKGRGTGWEEDRELLAIFERTYGPVKTPWFPPRETVRQPLAVTRSTAYVPEYLLVDGYNIIFAWKELEELARESIDAARTRLMDLLCNYQALKSCTVILVFDAYRVRRNVEDIVKHHNIFIVYTKEAETADTYIERATYDLGKNHRVSVVTSDYAEQLIILAHGALRISAENFRKEIKEMNREVEEIMEAYRRDLGMKPIGVAMKQALGKK